MTTPTRRLGLLTHTIANAFRIADWNANWAILDGSPGVLPCTYDTRPTNWNANHAGRMILETEDARTLLWRWDGSAFVRVGPAGLLGHDSIDSATGTTSTSLVEVLSADVTIPRGGRAVLVTVSGPGVYSSVNLTRLAIRRGATTLHSWLQHGRLSEDADGQPTPINATFLDLSPTQGPAPYSFHYSAEVGFAGTSSLQATVGEPLRLSVVEV